MYTRSIRGSWSGEADDPTILDPSKSRTTLILRTFPDGVECWMNGSRIDRRGMVADLCQPQDRGLMIFRIVKGIEMSTRRPMRKNISRTIVDAELRFFPRPSRPISLLAPPQPDLHPGLGGLNPVRQPGEQSLLSVSPLGQPTTLLSLQGSLPEGG